MTPVEQQTKIDLLNERAVNQLIAAHKQREDQPLVLAVRYKIDNSGGDVYLFTGDA